MSKASKRHMDRVASIGCVLCGEVYGDRSAHAELHHVFDSAARSDYLVIPLCFDHHRGPGGFHSMGQRAWERCYKTSEAKLLALTIEALS